MVAVVDGERCSGGGVGGGWVLVLEEEEGGVDWGEDGFSLRG